ncbi:glycosyltransferase family 4 protein [Allopusillimonas ginsengisoli]|nr:glycosyltransferase family 4 protein [Allopusillimonas ginsengisoli]
MRVLHLSVFRQLSEGQRKQLKFEADAAKQLVEGHWDTIALHAGASIEPFERRIPGPFRPMFLRALYAWMLMLRLSRHYDVVLCRHMTFDIFAPLFSWFVRNRASVHHAKEMEELLLIRPGLQGQLASWLERRSGAVAARTARAIIGVTEDIRQYELSARKIDKPSYVYPNGIFFPGFQAAPDHRSVDVVNAVFICERFVSWHGLDLLIDAANAYQDLGNHQKLKIHLIGSLTDAQIEQLNSTNKINDIFIMHGVLEAPDYELIMSNCDIGIGSLALGRKGLQEAATLKVREYLAIGLPVFSGHKDVAIPDDFEHYTNDECTIDKILNFGLKSKSIARQTVRDQSRPFIDKAVILQGTMDWLAVEVASDAHAILLDQPD